MNATIVLDAKEVAAIVTAHLRAQGHEVKGAVRFTGTLRYGGDAYDPQIDPVFTGVSVTVTSRNRK